MRNSVHLHGFRRGFYQNDKLDRNRPGFCHCAVPCVVDRAYCDLEVVFSLQFHV